MKIIQRIHQWLDKAVAPPSLTEVVSQQLQEALREEQQAQHVILVHRFQEHMARHRIAALEAWINQKETT